MRGARAKAIVMVLEKTNEFHGENAGRPWNTWIWLCETVRVSLVPFRPDELPEVVLWMTSHAFDQLLEHWAGAVLELVRLCDSHERHDHDLLSKTHHEV